MCIAIITTEHPQYPFILLSNRDEFLHRPTALAQWWDLPNSHVLGAFDLHRAVHGTWLGITRQGRIAVLTNYREEDQKLCQGARSRGEIVNAFLTTPPASEESTEAAAGRLMADGVGGIGGFSLIFGDLRDVVGHSGSGEEKEELAATKEARKRRKGLALISNRTPDVKDVIWMASNPDGETRALSNSHYGDRTWPKVTDGEQLVRQAIRESSGASESKTELLDRLFAVMSDDKLPKWQPGDSWETYSRLLRQSIFIPRIGAPTTVNGKELAAEVKERVQERHGPSEAAATSGEYGTQKQSIVMLDREGNVTFVERTLFDNDGQVVGRGEGDRVFEFRIENW